MEKHSFEFVRKCPRNDFRTDVMRKSDIKLSGVAIAKVDLIDAYLVQLDA